MIHPRALAPTTLPALFLLLVATTPSPADEVVDLTAHTAPGQITHVTTELEVGGDLKVRPQSDGQDAAEQKLPMSVVAKLEYDERRLAVPEDDKQAARALRSLRYYHVADAVLKIDNGGVHPILHDNHREIAVQVLDGQVALARPRGHLDRRQYDLLNTVGNTLVIDQLLPNRQVREGGTWYQDKHTMGALLCLDSVAVCEVQSVLSKFNDAFAQVQVAGTVHGMADGAATEMRLRAVYLYDRRAGRIVRLNMAIKEQRSIGDAGPGLDAVAKLKLKLVPVSFSKELTDAVVAETPLSFDDLRHALLYSSPEHGFRLLHDRRWFVTGEQRQTVSLRRIERGELLAHCSITTLPPKSEGRQATLEEFQRDVQLSLGPRMKNIVSADEWTNHFRHTCYRVVAQGEVDEVPVQWHYYLVSPVAGHRVSLAFTVEASLADRLGKSDRELVETLQLIPIPGQQKAQTAAEPNRPSAIEFVR